jgi:hypothetical protein
MTLAAMFLKEDVPPVKSVGFIAGGKRRTAAASNLKLSR